MSWGFFEVTLSYSVLPVEMTSHRLPQKFLTQWKFINLFLPGYANVGGKQEVTLLRLASIYAALRYWGADTQDLRHAPVSVTQLDPHFSL